MIMFVIILIYNEFLQIFKCLIQSNFTVIKNAWSLIFKNSISSLALLGLDLLSLLTLCWKSFEHHPRSLLNGRCVCFVHVDGLKILRWMKRSLMLTKRNMSELNTWYTASNSHCRWSFPWHWNSLIIKAKFLHDKRQDFSFFGRHSFVKLNLLLW